VPTLATTRKPKKSKPNATRVASASKRLASARARNGKARAKKHYDDDGALALINAGALALELPKMPATLTTGEQRRAWCRANGAPFVDRRVVCRKATNYRADNAVRARLASLAKIGAVSSSLAVVWNANNADATLAPFTDESERVFIVRV